jgi:esterase/lipase
MSDLFEGSQPLRVGDAVWKYIDKNTPPRVAKAIDFDHKSNVILVHGFTANGGYMETLAEALSNHDFNVFIFNYHSYRGIKVAADSLHNCLSDLNKLGNDLISNNGFSLVSHSMGGLVSRALYQFTSSRENVKSIVTMGTPHSGTLFDSDVVDSLIKWGQEISSKMPGFTPDCQSALELTKSDNTLENALLDEMYSSASCLEAIPTLSISAGKKWLEVGNRFKSWLANKALQKIFKGEENDGLVTESSSNLKKATKLTSENTRHINDYLEYPDLNHTYIIHNYQLSLRVVNWLKDSLKKVDC